jgi:hypothetical protein
VEVKGRRRELVAVAAVSGGLDSYLLDLVAPRSHGTKSRLKVSKSSWVPDLVASGVGYTHADDNASRVAVVTREEAPAGFGA